MTLSQDESALANDRADAAVGTAGGAGSPTYTHLPEMGQVIGRGQELFAIDGQPSILLYGNVTPWRAFMPGMAPGPDVSALNANLDVLGYGHGARGDTFTGATEAAVLKFQAAHHMTPTGQLALGSVLFDPGQIEVNSVTPTIGSTPSPGQAVLQVTLTARQVQIALDASQQSEVAVGDQVSIVMPNNSTTPGVVSYVGTVATTPSSQNGGSGSPTIEVNVTPLDPAATGNLDDLPVNVWITQSTVPNAFVVQVDSAHRAGRWWVRAGGGPGTRPPLPRGGHRRPVRRRRRDGASEWIRGARRPASGGAERMTGPLSGPVTGPLPSPGASTLVADGAAPLVLQLEGVTKVYPVEPPVEALRGVSFTIHQGELLAIVGPSGSG